MATRKTKPTKRYELVETDTIKHWSGATLFRIRALMAFGLVAAGDLGGYVEKEANLSQSVSGNAWVSGNASVFGDARVFGNAGVFGDASVFGDARVFGNASVFGVLLVCTRSDGYTFAVSATPSGPRIMAGCRYFSFEEAEAHWTKTRGGTQLGDESLAIVRHLRVMAALNGLDAPVAAQVAA